MGVGVRDDKGRGEGGRGDEGGVREGGVMRGEGGLMREGEG